MAELLPQLGSETLLTVSALFGRAGKLGVVTPSSGRFKEEIKPMDHASDALLALQPVTSRYKEEMQTKTTPQFGLVAEEVEKVAPELVVRNEERRVDGVRYEAVNAMLLNEFLKEHCRVEALEATVAQQSNEIKQLAAGLQKVSERVETSHPASQFAANGR